MTGLILGAVGSTSIAFIAALIGANYYTFGFACACAGWCVALAYAAAKMS